jgi:hypothetical protein
LDFYDTVVDQAAEICTVRARRASEACANPGFAGVMPRSGMPGACRSGIVKNQQRSVSEALHTGAEASKRNETPNPHLSRNRSSVKNLDRFAPGAQASLAPTPASPG